MDYNLLVCSSQLSLIDSVTIEKGPSLAEWTPVLFVLGAPLHFLYFKRNLSVAIVQYKFILAIFITLLVILSLSYGLRDIHDVLIGEKSPDGFILSISIVLTTILIQDESHKTQRKKKRKYRFFHIFGLFCSFGISFVSIFQKRKDVDFQNNWELQLTEWTTKLYCVLISVYLIESVILVLKQVLGANQSFEKGKADKDVSPEIKASFLSRLTWSWVTPFVLFGYRHNLEPSDLWPLKPEHLSTNIIPIFDKYWEEEVEKATRERQSQEKRTIKTTTITVEKKVQANLLRCVIRASGPALLLSAFYKLLYHLAEFTFPYMIRLLIGIARDGKEEIWKGYILAILMFSVSIFKSVVLNIHINETQEAGRSNWVALTAAIYKKTLRLTNAAKQDSTVGEIINLMSVDAEKIGNCMWSVNEVWAVPLLFSISFYFLWQTLGPSVLVGLIIILLLVPVNFVLMRKSKHLQLESMNLKDARIKKMNEVLNGIKVLKMYAWEECFEKRILEIRDKELHILAGRKGIQNWMHVIWATTPFMISLCTFGAYVLMDANNVMSAEKVFVSLSLFNILQYSLHLLPHVINYFIQTAVSLKRIQNFLNNEELDTSIITRNINSEYGITVEDGTFIWDTTMEPTLKDITFKIPQGSLVAIVGSVGAGKSSLLSAILGEMESETAKVNIKGSIAYVAQQPWIMNTSLQQNILFGEDLDKRKYEFIVDASALRKDLEVLPGGDQTEIGEKGINLSGGQKQRVSLARAVYQNADIYLLDDSLSAVDAHVGKHIFDEIIGSNGLLKEKTRILVTHGINYIRKVDIIITMVDGRIGEIGSFDELTEHDGPFAGFMKNYLAEELSTDDEQNIVSYRKLEGKSTTDETIIHSTHSDIVHSISDNSNIPIARQMSRQTSCESESSEVLSHNTLVQEENTEPGSVKLNVIMTYVRAVGVKIVIVILTMSMVHEVAEMYLDVWLSKWTQDHTNGTVNGTQRNRRLGIYGAIGLFRGVSIFITEIFVTYGLIKATRKLHKDLLRNILRSPMSFFDTTPVGRIVNRFSKDIETIDDELIYQFKDVVICLLLVLCNTVIISTGTPQFLFIMLPVTVVYFALQRLYVSTSRQLRTMASAARSPIFSHFGETISGCSTIRAFQQEERFMTESARRFDELNTRRSLARSVEKWLHIRLDWLGSIIVLCVCMLVVVNKDDISPGIVGLAITYALNVTNCIEWLVKLTTNAETNIISLERIKEYSETHTEADWIVENKRPEHDWPNEGNVEFDNYGVRYREGLELVLKSISCKIAPCEKIGIVGRTGAGKSSLTMGLFRIIEKAKGRILIDGIDISTIGLHDLRSKITIIPQDPVLFSGTMRMNLDPFDEYSNEDIWTALNHAHLKAFVIGLKDGLDHHCSEGGDNLSVGQRQLICLARALLRKTRILVLDEATAAVDLETDDLIQTTIRTEFADCTVLTIAHRLNTIMDYTRIMIRRVYFMDFISEYRTPEAMWTKLVGATDNKSTRVYNVQNSWIDSGNKILIFLYIYKEDLDLVLKGISCKILPCEKVRTTLLGRTGAGKSSLTMALFRILEPAQGDIVIDGVDISTIGLHDLRSKITIIPQDPVLFCGSIRMNLDPFDVFSTENIWRALEHAHLKDFVQGLDDGMDHQCSEGGENLSVGQRQLVCLARALLRKTKILVLDEATAAVDLKTDELIQNTIRTEFADCTVLTIAHRLNTIMDYTRVMVLETGRIKEFDSPTNLLQNRDSVFYSMAKNAGLVK
ncbi:ATP-binding cassette, subfamily C (CFTR/MRP), member 1 [Mytilus galloprovincialis]|uniref:ABC-type glutathione-S-conjugate transporter n=1 Tax=Mytilus galloprovincialis TaxID=29158 RepID=A0A8B6G2C8_MYTGA|nr:ATP-binding cassette, subfamily C (CFTR/MRP), member 1 [Mytilus galloprovincialis]